MTARGIGGSQRAIDDENIRITVAGVQPDFQSLKNLLERHPLQCQFDGGIALFEFSHQRQNLIVGPAHPDNLQGGLLGTNDIRHG